MAYVIFDLDGTVIDSSHRHATRKDGSLDLDHWFEKAVPEFIAKDGLLPLARAMRDLHKAGHRIVVCTSRTMQEADYQFLIDNNLPVDRDDILSRPGTIANGVFVGDTRSDEDLKEALLNDYFQGQGYRDAADVHPIMFDDNLKVVRRMIKIGVNALDARRANAKMRPLAA